MGTNYILKYKDIEVADLGRTHRTNTIDSDTLQRCVTELLTYAAYNPKNIDELRDIKTDMHDIIRTIMACGEKRLIDYMLDDPDLELIEK